MISCCGSEGVIQNSLLFALFVVFEIFIIKYSATILTRVFGTFALILLLIKIDTFTSIKGAIINVGSILLAVLTIQVAVPIFAPIIDISLGDVKYGFVYDNYTSTLREFKIDIRPPLFLTNSDIVNCREYNITKVERVRLNAPIGPLKTIELKNPSPDLLGFNETMRICLDSDKKLDAWKLGKFSTSVYLEVLQDVRMYSSKWTNMSGGDNTIYISDHVVKKDENLYTNIYIKNDENYPIIPMTMLVIKNDSSVYNTLRKMVITNNTCKTIYMHRILDPDSFIQVGPNNEVSREDILSNTSIPLGYVITFLKIEQIEPLEKRDYCIMFECRK